MFWTRTEEGEHEDAIVADPELVSIIKLIPGSKVLLLQKEETILAYNLRTQIYHVHTNQSEEKFPVELYRNPARHQGRCSLGLGPLRLVVGRQCGGNVVGRGVGEPATIFLVVKKSCGGVEAA